MLRIANRISELSFRMLMEVYIEGNQEKGQEMYPLETSGFQLAMAEQDFYDYLRSTFFRIPGSYYAVLEDDGRYVCALRMEPYQDGMLLSALETVPDMRRRGYGKALILEVLKHMGKGKVYSHVNKRNTVSLRTHEACGFRKILNYGVYTDGSVLTSAVTFMIEK